MLILGLKVLKELCQLFLAFFKCQKHIGTKGIPKNGSVVFNTRAYKKGWMPPLHKVFLNFSKMNNYLELPFSVAMHIFLRHILTQV